MCERAPERHKIGHLPLHAHRALLPPHGCLPGAGSIYRGRSRSAIRLAGVGNVPVGRQRQRLFWMVTSLPEVSQRIVGDHASEAMTDNDDPVISPPARIVVQLL